MRSRFIKFLKLSKRRKYLLINGIFLSVYGYFLFSLCKKKARFGSLNVPIKIDNKVDDVDILDIRFVIIILNKYIPWNFQCRHQAWLASILLKKLKIPYLIYVGFRVNIFGQMEGHAWTIAQNIMVSGFCNPSEYSIHSIYVG